MLAQTDDVQGALQSYRTCLDIRRRLADADPVNTHAQRDLMFSLVKFGEALFKAGDADGAIDSYGRALTIAEALVKLMPQDGRAQQRLAEIQESLAKCRKAANATSAASQPAGSSATQRAGE
jgi:tetratricopeptide (TPR) repeat protein